MKIDMLESRLREKEEELMNAATNLSEKRNKQQKDISKAVEKILKELALEKAGFRVDVIASPLSSGIDIIEFFFSKTRRASKPLAKAASRRRTLADNACAKEYTCRR